MGVRHRPAALGLTILMAASLPAGWAALAVRARTPDTVAERGTAAAWSCPMHPEITGRQPGTCPRCGMALTAEAAAAVDAGSVGAAIAVDTRRRQLMGVRTAAVTRAPLEIAVTAFGTVREDPARAVDLTPRVEGWIEELHVTSAGRRVRKGDPLFALGSVPLQTMQLEYLQALKKREVTRNEGVDYAGRVRERLEFLDVPADQIAALEEAGRPLPAVLFRSPLSGWVIDLQAVRGRRVMPGDTLLRLADLSSVWVEADLRERERALLDSGGRATVSIDGRPGAPLEAHVASIVPLADDPARTAKLRLEVANKDGRLQPGVHATVRIVETLDAALTVPADAVLDSGTRQIVFVAGGDGVFEPRDVTVGRRGKDRVQILSGLEEGLQVATGANFLLDAESQLQAALNAYAGTAVRPSAGAAPLSVQLRTRPDPPRAGEVELELSARRADGRPLGARDLTVVFSMPAMPAMNMPAMRSEARLRAGSDGRFRGAAHLSMAGRWNVVIEGEGTAARLTLLAR